MYIARQGMPSADCLEIPEVRDREDGDKAARFKAR